MTIRSDSFSSVDEVRGFTRHLLDGATTFTSTTRPTLTEIEKFIDRASALLNVALSAAGFTPSDIYSNAVSKLACDDWVTQQAVKYAHYAQRNVGIFSDKDEVFTIGDPHEFVEMNSLGFQNMGIALDQTTGEGLAFTGMDAVSERADPDDTTKAQPLFRRDQWANS